MTERMINEIYFLEIITRKNTNEYDWLSHYEDTAVLTMIVQTWEHSDLLKCTNQSRAKREIF